MDEQHQENRIVIEARRIIAEINERFGPKWQTYATAAGSAIVILALILYFLNSYNETKKSYWEKISMAQAYAYQGMTNQAIQILDDVIVKYSNSAMAQYARLGKGNILSNTRSYNLALSVYQEVINIGKQKTIIPFAYAGLGESKENLMDYAGAEAAYKEEIEKYPEHFITPRIYDSLARVYILTGKPEEAKQTYEKLATLYPGTYWAGISQKYIFSVSGAPQPTPPPTLKTSQEAPVK